MYLDLKLPLSVPCKQRSSGVTLSEYKSYVVNISCHQNRHHFSFTYSIKYKSYNNKINTAGRLSSVENAQHWSNLKAKLIPPHINYYQHNGGGFSHYRHICLS